MKNHLPLNMVMVWSILLHAVFLPLTNNDIFLLGFNECLLVMHMSCVSVFTYDLLGPSLDV
jgi:hypothetical protein